MKHFSELKTYYKDSTAEKKFIMIKWREFIIIIHQPPGWLRIVAFVKYCNNSSLFSVQLKTAGN